VKDKVVHRGEREVVLSHGFLYRLLELPDDAPSVAAVETMLSAIELQGASR